MSQLFVDNIKNRTGGAVGFPTGVVVTGVATFNNQVSIAGTLSYEDVTNIDSTGIITAKSGVKVTGGEILVGSGFSVGQSGVATAAGGSFTGDVDIADKIVHTGDTNTSIRFPAADTFTVETAGSERLRVTSAGKFGVGANPSIFFEVTSDENDVARFTGPNSGNIVFRNDTSNEFQIHTGTSDALIFGTNGENERLRITSTGGVHFNNAELIERVNITAGKLSDNQNINLDNGMVHLFTTTETATSTPNIISTAGINTSMATGDVLSVNIITTTAAAAYSERVKIDGLLTGITTSWNGGSAPSAGGSSGKDFYSYTIIKTGDAAFTVLGNLSNFA